jgi:hypothetical protein
MTNSRLSKPRGATVEEWDLYHHYIEVNAAFGTFKADTAAQLRIAKDFRNLINSRALSRSQLALLACRVEPFEPRKNRPTVAGPVESGLVMVTFALNGTQSCG